MAIGIGMFEALLFILLGGATPADLVSLMHADDYFEVRKIDLTVEKMIELAGKDPSDGKAQIQQLLALRLLGDDPNEVKKSPQHEAVIKLLKQIADGTKAQDRFGFARDYAGRTLARLEGRILPVTPVVKDSLRVDAFKWFPAAATMIGAADLNSGDGAPDTFNLLRKTFAAKIPPQQKEVLYAVAEALGNIRVDRASFAYVDEPNNANQGRIFIRFTGAGDRQRLIDVLEKKGEFKVAKQGDAIVLQQGNRPPVVSIVGDNDVLFLGYGKHDADHAKLIDEVLSLRSKGEDTLLAGKLKGELAKIPADVNALIVGDIPEELRQDLARGGAVPVLPHGIMATARRGKSLQVQFSGGMAGDEDAKLLSKTLLALRDQGLVLLQNVPAQVPVPERIIGNLKKTLQSLQLNAEGKTVAGSVQFDGNLAEMMSYMLLTERSDTRIEPPVPKKAP